MNKQGRDVQSESGVALIVVLISILMLSALVASIMFVTQTQTWTSYNYRVTTQARYAAEAGIQRTMNWILTSYAAPTTFGSYDLTKYPVQATANNQAVVLSALGGTSSNYPTSTVQTAYNTALSSQSIPGIQNATFSTSATLLRMSSGNGVSWLTGSSPGIPQTWRITSVGSIPAVGNILGNATVQLQATYERAGTPIFTYGVFANGNGCGALSFGGGGSTDSYNSTAALSAAVPVTSASGGDVGTNGNLSTNGSPTTINGTLSSPASGTGACGAGSVTAWTPGTGSVTGVTHLTQPVIYPLPVIPPPGTLDVTSNSSCPVGLVGCTNPGDMYLNASAANAGQPCVVAIPPNCSMNLHDLLLTGGKDLHLTVGKYNINTLRESGSTKLVLDSVPVILNVTGTGGGTVVDLTGNSFTNTTGNFDASSFQIVYAGSGTIALKGGANAVGIIYAPNAPITITGGADWFGGIIGNTVSDSGSGAIHYDSALQNSVLKVGPFVPVNFSWNKF